MKISQESLERSLEAKLREILESVPGIAGRVEISRNPASFDRAFDLLATIRLPGSKDTVEMWIDCQDLPRPSRFPYVQRVQDFEADGSRRIRIRVLAAPFVSERMAELCKKHQWGWFDLAGNCRLSLPGPIYIERTGIPPVHESPKPKANLSTAAAARVVRTLLAPQNAGRNWTQTSLQEHCNPGVSIGLVNKVVRHLRDEAWLMESEDGGFRVHDWVGLLEAWKKVYRYDRHRQIGYFTLLRPKELQENLISLGTTGGHVAYAVFTAAELQAPNVRQPRTWLYVGEDYLEEFAQTADARPVDTGANIIILVPDDDGVFYLQDGGDGRRLPCTNPVQTWIDLSHAGGRGEEGAESILSQCLKPAWESPNHA